MAITNYSDLQARLPFWLERNDLTTADFQEFISLAEARLNRELKSVETQATLSGSAGSRAVSISALSMIQPIALKVIGDDGSEDDVILRSIGVIDYEDRQGCPTFYEINGTDLKFNVEMDRAYTFRFVYRGRFALSDAAPTNKLLTEQPDVYLAASIVWSGMFVEDDPKVAKWKPFLDEWMAETRHVMAQAKRGELTVDPALAGIRRPMWVDLEWPQ
jgi:hypothetical protein